MEDGYKQLAAAVINQAFEDLLECNKQCMEGEEEVHRIRREQGKAFPLKCEQKKDRESAESFFNSTDFYLWADVLNLPHYIIKNKYLNYLLQLRKSFPCIQNDIKGLGQ